MSADTPTERTELDDAIDEITALKAERERLVAEKWQLRGALARARDALRVACAALEDADADPTPVVKLRKGGR